MFSFVQEMGIDPVKECEMLWIAEEAFHAPLPPGWSEHTDELGRAYFHCAATGESAWQHPMDSLFREVVNYYRRIQEVGGFWTVEDELAELEEQIRRDLADWMELFDEHGEKFYYNRQTEESRFDDPRNAVYHSLYTRIRMVAKIREHLPLLARAPRPEDPTAREVELRRAQEEEEVRHLLRVVKLQAFARALTARRRVRALRSKRALDRVPRQLKGHLRLRLEATGQGRDELVLAVTTPQRQKKAAAKIQARMRGVLARRRFQPRVNHHRFLDNASLVIQRGARRLLERRREAREAAARLHTAATMLQKVVRARRGRGYARELHVQRERWRHRLRCIQRVQSAWRCFLARRELKRLRHEDLQRRALLMQRRCRSFLARALLVRLNLVKQPVTCGFSLRRRGCKALLPWSWTLAMAPVEDEEVCTGPGRCSVDLFGRVGQQSLSTIAATEIQRRLRGHRTRRRVEEERLRLQVEREAQAKEDNMRREGATRIQARFRGMWTRTTNDIRVLRAQWRSQRVPNVEFLQRAVTRYVAQCSLLDEMLVGKTNSAAVVIQARWRGYVARRQGALLAEQVVWPMKAWFEYTPTGRDSVHVSVQFFSNPAFNAYRYFFEHGSKEELYDNLDIMEREVGDCVDNFLQTQSLRDWRSAEKEPTPEPGSRRSSRRASAEATPERSRRASAAATPQRSARTPAGDEAAVAEKASPTPEAGIPESSRAGGTAASQRGAAAAAEPEADSLAGEEGRLTPNPSLLAADAAPGATPDASTAPASARAADAPVAAGAADPAEAQGRPLSSPRPASGEAEGAAEGLAEDGAPTEAVEGSAPGEAPASASSRRESLPNELSGSGSQAGSSGAAEGSTSPGLSPVGAPSAGQSQRPSLSLAGGLPLGAEGGLALQLPPYGLPPYGLPAGLPPFYGLPAGADAAAPLPPQSAAVRAGVGGALGVLAEAAAREPAPGKPGERKHYAGVFKGGRFEKTRAASLEQLSEEQRHAILADLEEQRQRKVEELVKRQRRHAARQRREQRLEAQQVLGQRRGPARPQAPGHQGHKGPQGPQSPGPGRGAGLHDRFAPARPLRTGEPPPPGAGSPSAKQRVLHRHVHHHVHYHEPGEAEGPQQPGGPPFGEAPLVPLPYLGKAPPALAGLPPPPAAAAAPAAAGLRLSASMAELRIASRKTSLSLSASAGQLAPLPGSRGA